jgi:hypothetical protein
MKHIWADPNKEWSGFRLTSYSLDSEKVLALQLTEVGRIEGEKDEGATTVGEVYRRLLGRSVEIVNSIPLIHVTTDSEKLSFSESSFSCAVLTELLRIRKDGFDPFFAEWFFYDDNSSREGPCELYMFFVVHIDKIVRERVYFSDYNGSGFDPSVFQADDNSSPKWVDDGATREARTHYWYQRFYAETQTGQIMVLREDSPKLYCSESNLNPVLPPQVSDNALKLLDKIHGLLWVLILLLGLILFRLWR